MAVFSREEHAANFIEKAVSIHGTKYQYHKSDYVNHETKLTITCPVEGHGDFEQTPTTHYRVKIPCPHCRLAEKRQKKIVEIAEPAMNDFKTQYPEYDYSNTIFVNWSTIFTVYCPKHGYFDIKPYVHKKGYKCHECTMDTRAIERGLTTEKVVEKCKSIYGETHNFSYVNTVYEEYDKPLVIECLDHGIFEVQYYEHINGQHCPQCKKAATRKMIFSELVDEFNILYDNRYKYTVESFINRKTNIDIYCDEHGYYYITPEQHLDTSKGHCPHCPDGPPKPYTIDRVIHESKEIHGVEYIFDNAIYVNHSTKMELACTLHGVFYKTPNLLLTNKQGCPSCGYIKGGEKSIKDPQTIIARFNEIHSNFYNYDHAIFGDNKKPITIECPDHGFFTQLISNHYKCGCPTCGVESSAAAKIKMTQDEYIEAVAAKFPNMYTYEKVKFTLLADKITVTCIKHGDFVVTASDHLRKGRGCKKCKSASLSSIKGNSWLDDIDEKLGIVLEREYYIPERPNRPVDGYDHVTNTVYQFHGDYFHGNPMKFTDQSALNTRVGKTYGEIFDNSCRLDRELIQFGYNIEIMWETDWDLEVKRRKSLVKK